MIYLQLFWSFFQIGLFSIGGGYASIPLIQEQVTVVHSWLSIQEFIDILAIEQTLPGPIAINAATFVGIRVEGFWGGLVCTLAVVTPSLIIVLIIAVLYSKYRKLTPVQTVLTTLRPVVVALIASAAVTILRLAYFGNNTISFANFDYIPAILTVASLFVLRKFKLNSMWIMLGCGAIGAIVYSLI